MKNVYQNSKILSKSEFKKIEKAFEKAWCKETAYFDVVDKWSEDNKALGQCAITTVIIHDLFGGRMVYDKQNSHFWNELADGSWQDFSRSQFKDKRKFGLTKYKTKDEILYDENGKKKHTAQKYRLLKKKFNNSYNNLTSEI